jgi:hypothetical protein
MKEATKKKVVLKTNYDLSLSMSWQKKRWGGSTASYLASHDTKKQIDVSSSSTYVASGLSTNEWALTIMPTEKLVKFISYMEVGIPLAAALGNAKLPSLDRNSVPR